MLEEELDEFRLALRQYMECACAQTGCLQSVALLSFALQNDLMSIDEIFFFFSLVDVQNACRWIIVVMVFDLCFVIIMHLVKFLMFALLSSGWA